MWRVTLWPMVIVSLVSGIVYSYRIHGLNLVMAKYEKNFNLITIINNPATLSCLHQSQFSKAPYSNESLCLCLHFRSDCVTGVSYILMPQLDHVTDYKLARTVATCTRNSRNMKCNKKNFWAQPGSHMHHMSHALQLSDKCQNNSYYVMSHRMPLSQMQMQMQTLIAASVWGLRDIVLNNVVSLL